MANKNLPKQIKDLERRIYALEKTIGEVKESPTDQSEGRKLSIKEFLISKKPANDVQKTLVIAYYLERYENQEVFSVDDIRNGYERAKEPKPDNISDKLYLNARKGHIAEVSEKRDNKKSWHVTNTGERFLEKELGES